MIFSGGSNAAVTSEAVARMCSAKKVGVLINFIKFTGKRLCQSLFFNKVGGLRKLQKLQYQLNCLSWS